MAQNPMAPVVGDPSARAYAGDPIISFVVQEMKARTDDQAFQDGAMAALQASFKHAHQVGIAPLFHALRDAIQDTKPPL